MADIKDTVKATSDGLKDVSKNAEKAKDKVQEYNSSWEKVGATANASLSLIASSLSRTNPILGSVIGNVQKLIPNLVELGNAAQKTGGFMKAAFSSAGIGLLVVAITSVIDGISKVIDKHKAQEKAAKDAAAAEIKAAKESRDAWRDFEETINSIIYGQTTAKRLSAWSQLEEVNGTEYYEKNVQPIIDKYKNGVISLEEANEKFKLQIRGLNKDTVASYKTLYSLDIQEHKSYLDKKKQQYEDYQKEQLKIAQDILNGLSIDNPRSLDYSSDSIASLSSVKSKASASSEEDPVIAQHNKRIEAVQGEIKSQKLLKDARQETLSSFLESASSVYGTISGVISQNLETELAAGKISEKEYKKRAAALKAFGIASIVADTASGIMKIWKSYAAEKIANAETAAATGPAAAVTLASLNSKSLTSAILQTGMLSTAGAASIASLFGNSVPSGSSSGASAASVSYSIPQAQQVYVQNDNLSNTLESIDSKIGSQQTVLVLDDFNKVNDNMVRVKTQASF